MKNYFLLLIISFSTTLFAQDLANKVSANSPFVLSIKSKNLTNKVALTNLQEYPWMKNLLDKELQFLPKDLSQTGIDLTKTSYQYYTNRDTVMNYVVLIPLNNALQFEKLIQGKYGDSLKLNKQSNYTSTSTSKNHHLAWNDKFAVLVNATYTKPYKTHYNDEYSNLELMDSTSVVTDTVAVVAVEAPYEETDTLEEIKATPEPKKANTTKKSKSKKGKKTKKRKRVKAEPTEEEIYAAQEKAEAELEETNRKLEEIENKKMDSIERMKIEPVVDLIFKESFDAKNDKANAKIFKNNDPKSDFFAFADLDLLTSQFLSAFGGKQAALLGMYKNGLLNSNYSVNGYFEKDKIRLNQIITPNTDELKKSYQEMFDSKIDKNILKYIGANVLGYYSISMNSQAVISYEYSVMKNMLNTAYKSYSQDAKENEVDVFVEAIALFIDEKAIADLVPGNAIFVLHDLKKVQRDYVSYDYDDNYEQTETKETKDEIQPDFSFIMNTGNESFVNKLLKLPLDKNKITKTDYQLTNGYYTIHFEKDNLLENLYFGLKNGVFMISTSKENIENLLQNKTMPLQADFKKSISKNNSSAWLDIQKIIEKSKTELDKDSRNGNNWDIALKNAGEISFESTFKNGAITSESLYTIKGEHANSLEYLFNIINEFYKQKPNEVIIGE